MAEKLELLKSRAAIRAVDVANMLGTTPETVSRWNQGRAYPRPRKESLLVDLEYIVERFLNSIPTQGLHGHGCTRGTNTSTAFDPPT